MNQDIGDEINHLLREATSAADRLSDARGELVEYRDVLDALVDELKLDGQSDLLERSLTAESIEHLLEHYDFNKLHPVLLCEVVLDHSILPARTTRRLTEVTVRAKGEVWRIHKSDADPFPSDPHAHNLETNLKLDMKTGDLYRGTQKQDHKISKKDLKCINSEYKRLRKDAK